MLLSLSQSEQEPAAPTLQRFIALTSEGPFKSSIAQLSRHTRRRSSHQHRRALDQQSCAPSTPKSIFSRKRSRMRNFSGPSQTQPHQPKFSVLRAAQSVSTNPVP